MPSDLVGAPGLRHGVVMSGSSVVASGGNAEGGQGSAWVAGGAAQRGGQVDRHRPTQHPNDQIAQRRHGVRAAIGRIAVVLLVPFLGVIAYHVLGRPRLPAWLRAAVVGGGLVAYLVVLGIGALLGGIA
jgi:hypothetical protein